MVDPYIDPQTGILRNKLGIDTREELGRVEFRQSLMRMAELVERPVRGNFDRQHLEQVHKRLFDGIYDWAGKVRTVAMGKTEPLLGGASVSYPSPGAAQPDDNLDARLDYAFGELAREQHLKGIEDPVRFAGRFTHHLAQVWEVHPFREGNTRTVSAFMSQVARTAGRPLDAAFPRRRDVYRHALVMATAGNDTRHLEAHVKEGLGLDPGVVPELPNVGAGRTPGTSTPRPPRTEAEVALEMDAKIIGSELSATVERKVREKVIETAPAGMRAEFERLTEERIRSGALNIESRSETDRARGRDKGSEPDLER